MSNIKVVFTLIFFLLFLNVGKAQQNALTLKEVISLAVGQSISAKVAETQKENRYWQYRFYKSDFNPQLRLTGNLPGYNRDFARNNIGEFQSREQFGSALNLGLIQPIYWTGGFVSVNTRLDYFEDATADFTQYNTTIVNVNLSQPLFAFNNLKWDKKIEPIRYEESKRELVEEYERISQESVDLFFSYLDAQINLQISTFNLANNDTIYRIEQGRYNIGTTSKDKLLQVELQLLTSQQQVAQARLDLETRRLSLRSYIGLTDDESFDLLLPEEVPEFEVAYDKALEYAQNNRSAFIGFERRRLQAEAQVAEAKGRRFDADLNASFGYNNLAEDFNETYSDPLSQQRVNVTLSVPILDWGRNKARMQTAIANQRLNDYVIEQDKQLFEQAILTQVRQFEVLRLQLKITKKSDDVAQERYLVAQNRYLIGKIDITNLNIALKEKDDAKRSYINALRQFWLAYYQLRRLTLYDFSSNELLYKPEE